MIYFLQGCSHISKKKGRLFSFNEGVRALSLSGEGKARLSIGEEVSKFRFEMGHLEERSRWMIEISIPLYGAELMFLDWMLEKPLLKGSGIERFYLSSDIKNRKYLKQKVLNLSRGLSFFLKERSSQILAGDNITKSPFCSDGKSFIHNKAELTYNCHFDQSSIEIKGMGMGKSCFRWIEITLRDRNDILKLDLYYAECL